MGRYFLVAWDFGCIINMFERTYICFVSDDERRGGKDEGWPAHSVIKKDKRWEKSDKN